MNTVTAWIADAWGWLLDPFFSVSGFILGAAALIIALRDRPRLKITAINPDFDLNNVYALQVTIQNKRGRPAARVRGIVQFRNMPSLRLYAARSGQIIDPNADSFEVPAESEITAIAAKKFFPDNKPDITDPMMVTHRFRDEMFPVKIVLTYGWRSTTKTYRREDFVAAERVLLDAGA